MNRFPLLACCIILTIVVVFSSCKKTSQPEPQPLKVGLVGGTGGFSDAGFNQNILAGLQAAVNDLPIIVDTFGCKSTADFTPGIDHFIANGFNLIITSGYDASQATIAAAIANPSIDFVIIDYGMTNPPENLLCTVFDVDQSSFPCGFLAAYWADKQSSVNPVAGFVAGPDMPSIRQFSVSYKKGIEYFNTKYKKNVVTLGYYADSFSDSLQGVRYADSLIRQNASVVFTFAGPTGTGALHKVKEAGKVAIGVDVDQFFSIPSVAPALLTSCTKSLDGITYSIIYYYYFGDFAGGTTIHGNLSNNGVGIAPYHYFDGLIPDSIKTAVTNIKTGITNGTIKTGWPE